MQDAGVVIARLCRRVTQRFGGIRIQPGAFDPPDATSGDRAGGETPGQRMGTSLAGKTGDLHAVVALRIKRDRTGDRRRSARPRQDQPRPVAARRQRAQPDMRDRTPVRAQQLGRAQRQVRHPVRPPRPSVADAGNDRPPGIDIRHLDHRFERQGAVCDHHIVGIETLARCRAPPRQLMPVPACLPGRVIFAVPHRRRIIGRSGPDRRGEGQRQQRDRLSPQSHRPATPPRARRSSNNCNPG